MGQATELTTDNFDATINEGVSLIDFWAEWCGPCKMIAPMIEELATEWDGKATIGKLNVDNESGIAARYNVSSIPTLLLIKNGEEAQRFVGVTSKTDLTQALESAAS